MRNSHYIVILLLCYAWGAAEAQQTPTSASTKAADEDSGALEEIVVTVQRRAENLQTTAVAVSAFSGEALEQHRIEDLTELHELTPSLDFRVSVNQPNQPLAIIRGIGAGESELGLQPAVAFYYDGIYASGSTGAAIAGGLLDIDRIEVLRGPQGTLFGRNATGGAINIISKAPTNDFEAVVQAGAGNFGEYDLGGVLNLPISAGDSFRLVVQDIQSNGYGKDLEYGTSLYDQDIYYTRGTWLLSLSDSLQVVVRGEYSHSESGGRAYHTEAEVPGGPANLETAAELGLPFTPAGIATAYNAFLSGVPTNPYDSYNGTGYRMINDSLSTNGSVTVTYDLSDSFQVKAISAVRREQENAKWNSDGNAIQVLTGTPGISEFFTQITQELQFNGKAIENALDFASGLYFFHTRGTDIIDSEALVALNPASPSLFDNDLGDRSYAAYAQGTYSVFDRFRVTAGLRYTSEKNDELSFNRNALGCSIPSNVQIDGECKAKFGLSFNNWSYTAGADYQLNRNIFAYAKLSRGFKAGGENELGSGSAQTFTPFQPEYATQYEIGLKSDLLDRRLRANVALYHTNYSDIQRNVYVLVPPGAVAAVVQNAANGHIDGAEVELTWVPIEHLELRTNYAFTNARYLNYIVVGPPLEDRTHNPFPAVPRHQTSLSGLYTEPVPFGSIGLSIDTSFQTRVLLDPDDRTIYSGSVGVQPGYWLTNGQLPISFDAYKLKIVPYVRNLADKRYVDGAFDGTGSLGYGANFYGPPRTYGVQFTKRF